MGTAQLLALCVTTPPCLLSGNHLLATLNWWPRSQHGHARASPLQMGFRDEKTNFPPLGCAAAFLCCFPQEGECRMMSKDLQIKVSQLHPKCTDSQNGLGHWCFYRHFVGANGPAGDSWAAGWLRNAACIWGLCTWMKSPASKPQDTSSSKIWPLKGEACNVLPGVVPHTEHSLPSNTWLSPRLLPNEVSQLTF